MFSLCRKTRVEIIKLYNILEDKLLFHILSNCVACQLQDFNSEKEDPEMLVRLVEFRGLKNTSLFDRCVSFGSPTRQIYRERARSLLLLDSHARPCDTGSVSDLPQLRGLGEFSKVQPE
jgi:hypothetical protein